MKPILFNTEMVQAIMDGRKTVTRRIMKPQPVFEGIFWRVYGAAWSDGVHSITPMAGHSLYNHAPCHPGDILYVRETWAEMPYGYVYKADGDEPDGWDIDDRWKPSIHMPKDAARIFLRVKRVKVERLQDIDDDGVVAEGLNIGDPFDELWDSTIKKADLSTYGWGANPWVWVIEFERCEKPQEVGRE